MLNAKAFKHVHKNKEHPAHSTKMHIKRSDYAYKEMLVPFNKNLSQRNYKSAC